MPSRLLKTTFSVNSGSLVVSSFYYEDFDEFGELLSVYNPNGVNFSLYCSSEIGVPTFDADKEEVFIYTWDKISPLEISSCFSFILEKVKETRMRKQEEFLQLRAQLRDLHKKEKAWTKSFRSWLKKETPC